MHNPAPELIVVCGLRAEARLVAAPTVRAIAGGGDPVRLESEMRQAFAQGARAVLSFGLAAGLDPGMAPGMIVIADEVLAGPHRFATDRAWSERMRRSIETAVRAAIAGVDSPLVPTRDKLALYAATAAAAADMESHVAGRLALQAGLPFAVLRVIGDPAQRSLPPAAIVGMRTDGRIDPMAVLASLLAHPGQLPALIGLAADTYRAMRALRGARSELGPNLGWSAPRVRR